MKNQNVEANVALTAAHIARANPEQWGRFVEALRLYSSHQNTICIQSPLEVLPTNQGRAQATARLCEMLADCVSSADAIEGKRK